MILNIQYLRFAAAFIVIFAHANLSMYGIPVTLTNLGAIGVDIFFVISGFIMPYIVFGGLYTQNSATKISAKLFFVNRLLRIWPMYFIVTMVFIAVSFAAANGYIKNQTPDFVFYFNDYRYKIDYVIKSLMFFTDIRGPILTAGWTLQFEFIFYAIISISIACGLRSFTSIYLSTVISLTLFWVASCFLDNTIVHQLSRPIMIEFILGMSVYYLHSKSMHLIKPVAILYCVAFIPLILIFPLDLQTFDESHRVMFWGSASTLLVYSCLSLEKYTKRFNILFLSGNASYSIYLTHGVIAPIILLIMMQNDLVNIISLSAYMFIYAFACLSVGFTSYALIERPITSFLKQARQPIKAIKS